MLASESQSLTALRRVDFTLHRGGFSQQIRTASDARTAAVCGRWCGERVVASDHRTPSGYHLRGSVRTMATADAKTLLRGYTQAVERFGMARLGQARDPAYLAMFEALNCASSLDERLANEQGWHWRAKVPMATSSRAFASPGTACTLSGRTPLKRRDSSPFWSGDLRQRRLRRPPLDLDVGARSTPYARRPDVPSSPRRRRGV